MPFLPEEHVGKKQNIQVDLEIVHPFTHIHHRIIFSNVSGRKYISNEVTRDASILISGISLIPCSFTKNGKRVLVNVTQ